MNKHIFLYLTILISCQANVKEYVGEQEINLTTAISDSLEAGGMRDLYYVENLFEIDVKDFFRSSEAHMYLRKGDNYSMGVFVPLSFSVYGSSIFIPNRSDHSIQKFDIKDGTLIGEVKLYNFNLDYVKLLTNGSWLVCGWDKSLYEIDKNGNVTFQETNQDIFASYSENNILFRKGGKFYTKAPIPGNAVEINLVDRIFDYKLVDNEIAVVSHIDESKNTLVITNIFSDDLVFEIPSSESLNFNDYLGVRILTMYNNVLKVVLSTDNQDDPIVYTEMNLEKSSIEKVKRIAIQEKEEKFIGEGAFLWPNGWVPEYSDNNLYILYTTKDKLKVKVLENL